MQGRPARMPARDRSRSRLGWPATTRIPTTPSFFRRPDGILATAGTHGFLSTDPKMNAIFVAAGAGSTRGADPTPLEVKHSRTFLPFSLFRTSYLTGHIAPGVITLHRKEEICGAHPNAPRMNDTRKRAPGLSPLRVEKTGARSRTPRSSLIRPIPDHAHFNDEGCTIDGDQFRKSIPIRTLKDAARPKRQASLTSTLRGLEVLESRELLATFTVTNLHHSGAGSLRQAIIESNAATGAEHHRL